MRYRFELHVEKLCPKNPKTSSTYRRRGGASLGAQVSPKGAGRRSRWTPTPIRFGGGEDSSLFVPPPLLFFFCLLFGFFFTCARQPWADPTYLVHDPQGPWARPGGWSPLPVKIRNPFVIPGTLPVIPDNLPVTK